jgi:hypothetical protein
MTDAAIILSALMFTYVVHRWRRQSRKQARISRALRSSDIYKGKTDSVKFYVNTEAL